MNTPPNPPGPAPAQKNGALSPYRVLDLTEGGSALGPRILADMGADVLKVEPRGGSPSRMIPPFYKGEPHAERSLFWYYCNLNKRGITLDIARPQGQELFRRLVSGSDFLFESFEPGYLDGLGLGYAALKAINPRLIMVSITPFGQTGPRAHFKGPDIVPWAMGGYMWMCGDPDRPPVRPSVPPQAYFHASATGAGAALMALYGRAATGGGQHVDQSAQACGPWMLTHVYQYYEYEGKVLAREGSWRQYGATRTRTVFPCKDGHIVALLAGGQLGGPALNRLVWWMAENGLAPEWMKAMDWTAYDARRATQELTNNVSAAIEAFLRTKTRAEVFDVALERGIFLAPVNSMKDLPGHRQLEARGFWTEVEHPELGVSITYPGAPFIASETPARVYRRAPLIGEHNQEVYQTEVGLTDSELAAMRREGVI